MFFKKFPKIPFFQWFFRFLEKNFWYFQNISKTAQYFFLLVSRLLRRALNEFSLKKSTQNSNSFVFKKFLTILFFHYFFRFFEKKICYFQNITKNTQYFLVIVSHPFRRDWKKFTIKNLTKKSFFFFKNFEQFFFTPTFFLTPFFISLFCTATYFLPHFYFPLDYRGQHHGKAGNNFSLFSTMQHSVFQPSCTKPFVLHASG